jgi:adenine/guanine phosphoribosyltransferase-like PRPP-binding protein
MSQNGQISWTNERRKLCDLVPWPRNPRQIKKDQARRLVDSFKAFNQVEPVAIGPDGDIYNGHQRLDVLRQEYGEDYEIDVRVASRALTEKEREKLTVYLHRGAVGEWDFDILANEFELPELLEWGFEEKELIYSDFGGRQDSNLQDDVIALGIKRQRWSFRHGKGFLSLRSFTTRGKSGEIEFLKKIKREKLFIGEVAEEIANALLSTFGSLVDFVVTSAPEHKTGFSFAVCQAVGQLLGIETRMLFGSEINVEAPRRIFGERPEIKLIGELPQRIIWIDDTLTTGRTLEACRELCSSRTFIPLVWIYDDAQGE